jgi:outer membrane biosynthesis protein TonB
MSKVKEAIFLRLQFWDRLRGLFLRSGVNPPLDKEYPVASTIGIKLANGHFFPIIEEPSIEEPSTEESSTKESSAEGSSTGGPSAVVKEKSLVRKRLILTTVRDSQESMQIDLYRKQAAALAGLQYVGSIVVKDIKPKSKGDPSVELVISLNKDGALSATAADLDAQAQGGYQRLDVSLKSLDIDVREPPIPDFRMEQAVEPPPRGLYDKASQTRKRKKKKFPWFIIIIIGALIVLAGLGVWFFLSWGCPDSPEPAPAPVAAPAPELPVRTPEPAPAPPPVIEVAPEPLPAPPPAVEAAPEPPPVPVIEPVKPAENAPAVSRERRSAAPVSSYKVPAVIPKGGVAYRIRWGDTLWDISEAFYRNPWLYRRIARYNGIRNPDRIISGTVIRIPPRN